MIALKAVGRQAVENMKLIADKVTFSIEEEGLYKVQRNVLPDLKFGANGPTYECIELRV